jgi:hypothetical protein
MVKHDSPPQHRPARHDDLLSGFNHAERTQELRAFFATTITASLVVWDLMFTLGAYHTVFYSRLFQILVLSSVLLLGTIVLRRDITVRPWTRAILAVPLIWILSRLISPLGRSTHAGHVLDITLITVVVICVPFTLWAAARIVAPDYFELPDRRFKVAAVSIVIVVALTALMVGQFNFRFTSCHDYDISGDNTPANCRHTPTAPLHAP